MMDRIHTIARNIRLAFRRFRNSPAYALTAIITLALGSGATLTVFSLINSVLLRPLPWRNPDTVGLIWAIQPSGSRTWLSFAELQDLRNESRTLAATAGFTDLRPTFVADGIGQELQALAVSGDFFELLGVSPAIGRSFSQEDDRLGASPVVILSDSFWRNQFGSNPAVLGRSLNLNDKSYSVIGVLPEKFSLLPASTVLPGHIDVWLPLEPHMAARDRSVRFLHAMARLREAATFGQAGNELKAYAARARAEFGVAYPGGHWDFRISSFKDDVLASAKAALYLLFGLVLLVLLMACSNVANLLLVRGEARQNEIAIKTALGARASGLAGELLTEALVLAAIGNTLGLALASLAPAVIRALDPDALPRLAEAHLDARVVAFTVGLMVVTTVLFAAVPILERLRMKGQVLLGATRSGGRTRRGARLAKSLVVVQTTLATAILVTAFFLSQSLMNLQGADLGFRPQNVISGRISLSPAYPPGPAVTQFFDRAIAAVEPLPGVSGVSAITHLPLSGALLGSTFLVERGAEQDRIDADLRGIMPGYFEVVGTPLIQGRHFEQQDIETSPPVSIVDEAFARRLRADGNVIGSRIRWFRQPDMELEIVGVVRSVRHRGPGEGVRETVYRPHRQYSRASMFLVVRTEKEAEFALPHIRAALASVDPTQPFSDVFTMEQRFGRSIRRARVSLLLAGALAVIALTLSLVGLYGVLSFGVLQRMHEFGVRMAVGATPAAVRRMVLLEGLALTVIGTILGGLLAAVLAQAMRSLLYGTGVVDAQPYALGVFFVLASSALAFWLPAQRAGNADPMSVLRPQ